MQDNEIKQLSFEQASEKLEEIIRLMEEGELELDKSIEYYELGTKLKKHCEQKLQEAKLKVEKITVGADGEVKTEEFLGK